jgi:DNA repair exonuclease SbcCD ATPase subunit
MEKKDGEIRSLTERLGAATLRVSTPVEDPRLYEFQQENKDLRLQINELKKKFISQNQESSKSVDLKEYNEQITRMKGDHQKTINEKQGLMNQSVALQKETDILKDRIKEMEHTISDLRKLPYGKVDQGTQDKANGENQSLKSENTELRKRLRELESKSSTVEKVPQTDAEKANAELSKMLKERDNKILSFTDKIQELESKVSMTLKENEALRNQSVDATKGKVAQLDAATKKLTSDLGKAQGLVADAKKEMAKLKAENTGLKNQFDKLKNDYEKATGKKVA